MRKLSYYLATSLDGFVAHRDGGVNWLFTDGDYGMSAFFAAHDTVLMGRKTYEKIRTFGLTHYQHLRNIVFSRTHAPNEHIEVVRDDIADFVQQLKDEPGRGIWLCGGGELAAVLFEAELIDTLIVTVHPVLLGDGIALTAALPAPIWLDLEGLERWPNGLLGITYQVRKSVSS